MLQNCRTSPDFKGIRPAYQNNKGFNVIPIEIDPKQEEIDSAIKATQKDNGYDGMNGTAYMLGEDLVVKKYKKKGKALNYDPMREISALDNLYESGNAQKGNQRGLYAFKNPDGTYFMVSTKVNGKDTCKNPDILNKENLASLAKKIAKLDAGTLRVNENGEKVLMRPMHNDLSNGNIKFDSTSAGIFDFEYMQYENIDSLLNWNESHEFKTTDPHISDIMGVPSNLRSFEHRALYKVMEQTSKPRETFDNYLNAKSIYYAELSKDLPNEKAYEEYKKRCFVHSKILSLALNDPKYKHVKTAEAIKIQISRWLYKASPASGTASLNPKQIEEYITNAKKIFSEHYDNASEGSLEKLYYEDALKLLDSWDEILCEINYALIEPNETLPEEQYRKVVSARKKLFKKISDKDAVTLDKLIAGN